MENEAMIYVHVPFCVSRCVYCDFYSTTKGAEAKQQYVEAACGELNARVNYLPTRHIKSIYFGGGTPSTLSTTQLRDILLCIIQNYDVSPKAEITIEANPDDMTDDWVKGIAGLGFNRVSLGVQSFNNETLRKLNRRHTAEQAQKAVLLLHDNGIFNISIDLIYGLPGQTLEQFCADLDTAFTLPIRHLSSYALSVEDGTVLARKINSGEWRNADEALYISAFDALMNKAAAYGFEHYEISNFAQKGYASQHNSGYWDGTPYLGIGPGAHSFDGTNRRYNLPNLQSYLQSNGQPSFNIEELTREERFDELVFTALRTKRGLSLRKVIDRYGQKWLNYLLTAAQPHLEAGRMQLIDDQLSITRQGIMTSDDIMSDLMCG